MPQFVFLSTISPYSDFDKKISLTGTEENIQLAIINAFISTIFKKEKEQAYLIFDKKLNLVISDMYQDKVNK